MKFSEFVLIVGITIASFTVGAVVGYATGLTHDVESRG